MVDISFLIDRLAPLIEKTVIEEYNLFVNSKNELVKLSSNLTEIQSLLEEAEKLRVTDPRVRRWLIRLQDITNEIEEILDEWDMKTGEPHFSVDDENEITACMDKVRNKLQTCFYLNFKHVFRHRGLRLAIKGLNEQVDLLATETVKYDLIPVNGSQPIHIDTTTPFAELCEIKTQSDQVKKLVIMLLSSQVCDDNMLVNFRGQAKDIHFYSLVGMAGVGKTTIAQLVFHDNQVQAHFPLRLWTCASNCSDGVGICKAILEALNIFPPQDNPDIQTLLHQVTSSISRKRFLIVLDDVRIEDNATWMQFKACFRYGAPGSRILVTTRNKRVAKVMGHASRMELVVPLSDSLCGILLKWFAFQGREENHFLELKCIAQSLAAKCKGMPLVAKTLGIYLNSTDSEDLWSEVLGTQLWEFGEMSKIMFSPLASSYKDLPLVLKHCLTYCITFLTSRNIEVNELIRLWMVHGYINSSGMEKEADIRGKEYVAKLEDLFFLCKEVDQSSRQFTRVNMPDIFYDFAHYFLENNRKKQLQHFYSGNAIPERLNGLKYTRVMILRDCNKLPSKLGSLIHLKYLDLKGSDIKKLPPSVCNMYNLQTLDLQNCEMLSELPTKIHKLRKNLRFLLLKGTDSLKCLPKGIKRLTSIQTLDRFFIGIDCSMLGYLKNLNKLQGSLRVLILVDLTNREHVAKAEKAQLKNKSKLSDLTFFIWADVTKQVMEALEPPPNLQSLCMDGYGARELPSWFGTSLHSVKKLEIKSCSSLLHLPPLGILRSLEELKIDMMDSLTSVGTEFIGPFPTNTYEAEYFGFPKLKILTFRLCGVLRVWEDNDDQEEPTLSIMPVLESLNIENCPRLEGLPTHLLNRDHQVQVHISDCPRLAEMLNYLEQN